MPTSSQVAYKQDAHQILGKGRGRREETWMERKDRLPATTTEIKRSRKALSQDPGSHELAPAPLLDHSYDLSSWVPSPFVRTAPRSTEEPPPQSQSKPRRQYRSYHAPGTKFRTYQGPGERGRGSKQISAPIKNAV